MSQIRTKLGLTPIHGWKLTSIYQHGYRLELMGASAAAVEAGEPGDEQTG